MAVKRVWRFVDWVLKLDCSGSPPMFAMTCMSCNAESDTTLSPEAPQDWALKHAGRTGHDLFQAVNTSFFRATPVDDAVGARLRSDHEQAEGRLAPGR